jgi:hypothetical protein
MNDAQGLGIHYSIYFYLLFMLTCTRNILSRKYPLCILLPSGVHQSVPGLCTGSGRVFNNLNNKRTVLQDFSPLGFLLSKEHM